jgi:hypothetical protein
MACPPWVGLEGAPLARMVAVGPRLDHLVIVRRRAVIFMHLTLEFGFSFPCGLSNVVNPSIQPLQQVAQLIHDRSQMDDFEVFDCPRIWLPVIVNSVPEVLGVPVCRVQLSYQIACQYHLFIGAGFWVLGRQIFLDPTPQVSEIVGLALSATLDFARSQQDRLHRKFSGEPVICKDCVTDMSRPE